MKAENMLLLAVGAYFLYTRMGTTPQPSFQMCRYPDGTTIAVPVGNPCPIDPLHGGQSVPCGSGAFWSGLPC